MSAEKDQLTLITAAEIVAEVMTSGVSEQLIAAGPANALHKLQLLIDELETAAYPEKHRTGVVAAEH